MRRLPVVLGATALLAAERRPGPGRGPVPARPSRWSTRPAVLGRRGGGRGRDRRAAGRGRHPALRGLRRHLRGHGRRRVDAVDREPVRSRWRRRAARRRGRGPRTTHSPCRSAPSSPADEANSLAGQYVEPEFAAGDWSTGAVAFADILRDRGGPRLRLRLGRRGRGAARRRGDRGSPVAAPTWCRGRGGASGRRSRRRCSGWSGPTRTPGRAPRSSRAARATPCSSSTRR